MATGTQLNMGKTDSDGDGVNLKVFNPYLKGTSNFPCGKMNLWLPQYLTFHQELGILSEIS